MNLTVQRTERPGGVCVAVAGEVDVESAPRLTAELLDAVRLQPLVTVDLSAVTFMDSQGLSSLLRAWSEAGGRGGSLRLERVPARVLKLLRMTRLDSVFVIDSVSTGG